MELQSMIFSLRYTTSNSIRDQNARKLSNGKQAGSFGAAQLEVETTTCSKREKFYSSPKSSKSW